ncbi:MAG TPA: HlyD family secretion protein [Candidatus Acidoferrales bacterium]|nr:HlyD family secretion protein [Candidatus Acidoferrales bacterium]
MTPTQEAVEAPPAASRNNLRTRLVVVLVLLLILAAAAYAVFLHYRDRISSDDANVDGHVTAVAPKVSGNVVEVAVQDNQEVKAGQVLVRIDPRDYQARVDLAKAAVLQAESQLSSARTAVPWVNDTTQSSNSLASAQMESALAEVERARAAYDQASTADLAYAEANIRSKQASSDRAQADLARMKPLLDKAEISKQQYDAYLAAARVAEGDLKASQEKLASAQKEAAIRKAALDAAQTHVAQAKAQVENSLANRKQVDIRKADVSGASASVEAARARLEAAELDLSYTTITAPLDGVVTRKSVEMGQIVQPGQSLMAIIPLHDTWITANFKETQLANVRPGQKAEIHVDMYGRSVTGHVDSIAGATGSRMSLLPPENATGNFVKVVQRIPVKILVDQTDGLILRPGMNVDVTIFTR